MIERRRVGRIRSQPLLEGVALRIPQRRVREADRPFRRFGLDLVLATLEHSGASTRSQTSLLRE